MQIFRVLQYIITKMNRYTEDSKKSTSNNRLKVRELADMQMKRGSGNDHSQNLDRLMMERENLFEQDSNSGNKIDEFGRLVVDKYKLDQKFGEITGNEFETHEMDRGLPVRSAYSKKRTSVNQNDHFDFDLFDDRPSTLNVTSFDPTSTQGSVGAGFADVPSSMAKMSSQLNPVSVCSTQIDRLNNNLYYFLFEVYENAYVTNGYGLFNLFASLFFSANGMTEIELKKFFGFPKKEELYKGLMKINKCMESVERMLNYKNFLIIGSDLPYDPHYHDTIRDFCILVRVDVSKPFNEAKKLNEMIKKIMGTELRNIVTPENLDRLQLMLLTTATLHPVWASPFDKITKGIFYGYKYDEKLNFLHAIGKPYGYFEDTEHQMLEVKCAGNELVMGFLLYKKEVDTSIDDVKLHFYVSHMKECVVDEVRIPIFEQDFKIRYNNTLNNLGLSTVFTKMICPKFFPENVVLQDVVQNIRVTVDGASVESSKDSANRGYKSAKKFICDKPFLFYFRLVKTDTVLMMGHFQ